MATPLYLSTSKFCTFIFDLEHTTLAFSRGDRHESFRFDSMSRKVLQEDAMVMYNWLSISSTLVRLALAAYGFRHPVSLACCWVHELL